MLSSSFDRSNDTSSSSSACSEPDEAAEEEEEDDEEEAPLEDFLRLQASLLVGLSASRWSLLPSCCSSGLLLRSAFVAALSPLDLRRF